MGEFISASIFGIALIAFGAFGLWFDHRFPMDDDEDFPEDNEYRYRGV